MTLVTQIMMEEAGFNIKEVLIDCKRQPDFLKLEKELLNQYQNNLDIKTNKSNKLRRDAADAKKKLLKALQEELKDVTNKDDEKEPNALRVLMQMVTTSNTSDMKKATKTIRENPVIGKNLPKDILDKSTNMVNIVDKLCKADAEEDTAKRTFNIFTTLNLLMDH